MFCLGDMLKIRQIASRYVNGAALLMQKFAHLFTWGITLYHGLGTLTFHLSSHKIAAII
jgi:hypothetical protein